MPASTPQLASPDRIDVIAVTFVLPCMMTGFEPATSDYLAGTLSTELHQYYRKIWSGSGVTIPVLQCPRQVLYRLSESQLKLVEKGRNRTSCPGGSGLQPLAGPSCLIAFSKFVGSCLTMTLTYPYTVLILPTPLFPYTGRKLVLFIDGNMFGGPSRLRSSLPGSSNPCFH